LCASTARSPAAPSATPSASAKAASVGLEALAAKYDAFVIVSSSYGDGDPPSNFENFLRALYTADEGVLAGKQHCVLGYGSTDYETFQNCPRLTDKLMGALLCGNQPVCRVHPTILH
jgi:sulfite reductase alpha subunit-like flavoprotein